MDSNRQTLVKIAKILNDAGIAWGVGASMLLAQYGLADNPADIDIIVALDDIDEVDALLSSLGSSKKQKEKSEVYRTDFFYEYIIDSVEIDAMSGFKIKLPGCVFEYKFNRESIPRSFMIEGIQVPFMSLEEWYVLYQLMPGREYKAGLLEKHFDKSGIEYPYLLEHFLEDTSLPPVVKKRIRRFADSPNRH